MSTQRRREVAAGMFFLLLPMVVADAVRARGTLTYDAQSAEPPKGALKTIQSGNGDIVDCVDIYKQPAFDHPLLKNHTIQMKPTFWNEVNENHERLKGVSEDSGVDCPEGTVPIVRETSRSGDVARQFVPPYPLFNLSGVHIDAEAISRDKQEYAIMALNDLSGTYHGARGTLNVWAPWVVKGEFTTSQIWIVGGSNVNNANTIEAGWMVEYEADDRLSEPKLFVYWTSDGYRSTGCFNFRCPGFVQTSKEVGPGSPLRPASVYDGKQTIVNVEIKQDMGTGNWWFLFQGKEVGYWPASLVPSLRGGAGDITWGGQILNNKNNGQHTATEMGSGRFAHDGLLAKSAFISNLAHIQKPNLQFVPTPMDKLLQRTARPECYDLVKGPPNRKDFGTHFYFGGPGLSGKCQ